MQTLFAAKFEIWSDQSLAIKIDDHARQYEDRLVSPDEVGILKDFVRVTQDFDKSIVGEQHD
jgi:sulfur transfer complex TusBCD TusB component (DsrH family)